MKPIISHAKIVRFSNLNMSWKKLYKKVRISFLRSPQFYSIFLQIDPNTIHNFRGPRTNISHLALLDIFPLKLSSLGKFIFLIIFRSLIILIYSRRVRLIFNNYKWHTNSCQFLPWPSLLLLTHSATAFLTFSCLIHESPKLN